jgi:hypothetical protein
MRIALLATAVLATWTAAAPAQGWAEKMFTSGTSHDFGTVPRGSTSVHRFKITNIYAVPMDITNLKPSCGCVSANAAKLTLAPREESYIEVRMDGRRYTGLKTVTVLVTVGPRFVSTAQLKISANGRSDVVFNPGEVNFGLVSQGSTPSRTVDVEYAGTLPWQVTEVQSSDAAFKVTASELYRKVGRVGYRLTVALKKDAPAGILKNEIVLKTNDPASPTVPLLVEGIIQSSLIVVRSATPFKVSKVDPGAEGVELAKELSGDEKAVHLIELKLKPGKVGPFRWTVLIQTSAQAAPLSVVVDGSATR